MLRDRKGVDTGILLDDDDLIPAVAIIEEDEPVEEEIPSAPVEPRGWRVLLHRLDEFFPRLSRWFGGRLDIELPAVVVSVAVHVVFLSCLGMVGYAVHQETANKIVATTVPINTEIPDIEETTASQDFDQALDEKRDLPAGSFAPVLSLTNVSTDASAVKLDAEKSPEGPSSLAVMDVQRATMVAVPSAAMLGKDVMIKGNGAEHVGEAEGAVDRLADEILRFLEKGRTLVVWAFDASGSLQGERERLAKHIETVYARIKSNDEQNLAAENGLLTSVVAFGQDRKAMTEKPTSDPDEIAAAIRSVPLDTTGIESTFFTVGEIVKRWGKYKDAKGDPYRLMVMVVTDEVGDDEDNLENTIKLATDRKVPVYVLGSNAIFARTEGRMDYTDPKTGRRFFNIPVRQGPESVEPEQIRLPFWYGGEQFDVLDSGFGPYALSRLAGATGGIYFITRLGQGRMGFDPVAMREYKPDWMSREQYESAVLNHPIRKAVIEASYLTRQNLPGMPSLVFPPVDGTAFKETMNNNQAISARTQYTVDEALEAINAVAKDRDREPSRRWQAHYDLIRGRLLAMKVRCNEYNWICAEMAKNPRKFEQPNSNAWRLVPDAEVKFTDKRNANATSKLAEELLKKVLAEHPNTPWALFAQRELRDPFSFKWAETYIKPPPPPRESNDPPAKKAARPKMEKPVEPPKL